ncbi:hypothetical protein JW960_05340 [candidate division KSB1 bacterium]|nr:hypothetical protein [candidate division KSB1 bacterium]
MSTQFSNFVKDVKGRFVKKKTGELKLNDIVTSQDIIDDLTFPHKNSGTNSEFGKM